MKKLLYIKQPMYNTAQRPPNTGFTIVEIIVTVALAGLFVGVFVSVTQAYQTIRFEAQRKTEAYSVAQQLALNNRGTTDDSITCSSTARQPILENQAIEFNSEVEGSVKGDGDLLINPTYSLYGQYPEGCSGELRVTVRVTYGKASKREGVESIAL